MTFQLNTKLVFDGRPPKEFTQAVKEFKSGKFKTNPEQRKKMLNLQTLSDFFSGKGVRTGYGIEGFIGFLGEPDKGEAISKGYAAPGSTPDIEVREEDLRKMLPKRVVDQIVAAQAEAGLNIEQDLLTLELKQTIAKGKTSESITQQTPGRAKLDELAARTAKVMAQGGKAKDSLMDWFLTEADSSYRRNVILAITQKITNLITITYIDEKGGFSAKPEIAITPGAAKVLDLKNPAKFRQYVTVELFGSRSKGFTSIQYNLNSAAYAILKKASTDVTKEMMNRIGANFGDRLFQYYVRGGGAALLKKRSGIELVQTFGELIALAAQFDPTMGGQPFEISQETDLSKPMGTVSTRARPNLAGARKRKLKPDIQERISSEQIEALARRLFRATMPKGEPGGPPRPNPLVLTERTGRFAESFQILRINEKKRFLEYTYDPIYNVFESERRAPSKLIETQGLRPAVQQIVGQYFRFIRK